MINMNFNHNILWNPMNSALQLTNVWRTSLIKFSIKFLLLEELSLEGKDQWIGKVKEANFNGSTLSLSFRFQFVTDWH